MDTIYFAKVHKDTKIPTRRDEDGCYDLYAAFDEKEVLIAPHKVLLISTGIISAFDSKYRIAFRERGSNVKPNLAVKAGQIDSGFRGEWFVAIRNDNDTPVYITKESDTVDINENRILFPYNKAICQFAVERVPDVEIAVLTPLEISRFESERGTGKLGSSGK